MQAIAGIDAKSLLQSGMIVMWSGTIATIPSGFYLCDGNNGTPDLRDKMIVGAKQDDSGVAKTNISGSLTQSGGAATVTLAKGNIPAHIHTVACATGAAGSGSSGGNVGNVNSGDGSADGLKSSPDPVAILNPYYALAFIMKS